MRKLIVGALVSALVVPFGLAEASAEPERYSSKSYNAFWHNRRRIDSDTYLRTTWYAGVYASEETGEDEAEFWSDLYKSTDRCERRPGRDRCRGTGGYLVGVINDLGNGEFTLDPGLQTGSFEATYPMRRRQGGEWERVGKIRITVELVAAGEVKTYRESYSYDDGCVRARFSGRWESVRAEASGDLTYLRTDKSINLRATKQAWMSQGESMSIEHTCDEEA